MSINEWHITILTLFTHRYGMSIGDRIELVVPSNLSLADFLTKIQTSSQNRQPEIIQTLQPHISNHIYEDNHDGDLIYGRDSPLEGDQPNCTLDLSSPKAPLSELGLCDGAVLEQHGNWLPGYKF